MEDYRSNSHKAKAEAKEAAEKKVDKVVTGNVKRKKKSEVSKFKDVFISEDVSNVKSYIFLDVLVPAIKKAVSDIVKDGVDMMLYGDKRSGSRGSSSYVSYRSYSDNTSRSLMNESILTSIKAQLGIQEEYTAFDQQIVMHINSVLMVLKQLGVGPVAGFVISDKTAIWRDFLPSDKNLEATKSYIGMKVKMLFDPPTTSVVADSMNRMINELEWRLNSEAESEEVI